MNPWPIQGDSDKKAYWSFWSRVWDLRHVEPFKGTPTIHFHPLNPSGLKRTSEFSKMQTMNPGSHTLTATPKPESRTQNRNPIHTNSLFLLAKFLGRQDVNPPNMTANKCICLFIYCTHMYICIYSHEHQIYLPNY